MAVSVSPDPANGTGVGFDDDGVYWFLYPYFERVAARTGQMIDPYGDAEFAAAHLATLLSELEHASADAVLWSGPRDVVLGWRGGERVVETVPRERVLAVLREFVALVEAARRDGNRLVCVGD